MFGDIIYVSSALEGGVGLALALACSRYGWSGMAYPIGRAERGRVEGAGLAEWWVGGKGGKGELARVRGMEKVGYKIRKLDS